MLKNIIKGVFLILMGCLLVNSAAAAGLFSSMKLYASETMEGVQQEAGEDTWIDKAFDILEGTTGTLSRGTAVAVLYSVAHEPDINFEVIFMDVSRESDYAEAIIWAYKSGIVLGFGDGSFKPYETITKEQFALMLYQYARNFGYDMSVPADFPQIPQSSDWAQHAMRWAVYFALLSHDNPRSPLMFNMDS